MSRIVPFKIPRAAHKHILRKYDMGCPLEPLAQRYGVDRTTIYRLVHRYRDRSQRRVYTSSKLWSLSEEDKAGLISLYLEGEPLTSVGNRYQVTSTAVRRFLLRNKIALRSPGQRLPSFRLDRDKSAIIADYQSGLSLDDLEAKWNINHEAIRRMLIREGLPRRARGFVAKGLVKAAS